VARLLAARLISLAVRGPVCASNARRTTPTPAGVASALGRGVPGGSRWIRTVRG